MPRKFVLRFWMLVLLFVLLLADAVLVGIATTVLVAIYSATRETVATGDSVQWEPNVADVVSTAVDGLASPWGVGVLVLLAVQVWLLLRNAGSTRLAASATEDPSLTDRVRRLARAVDLPTPAVRVVDSTVPNSFVVGRTGDATIYVTSALRDRLGDDELDAVLAHELAHVRNRDVTVTTLATNAVPVGSVVMVLSVAGFVAGLAGLVAVKLLGWVASLVTAVVPAAVFAGLPGADLVFLAVYAVALLSLAVASVSLLLLVTSVPLVLAIEPVARRFGWTREYAADEGAVEITGNPAALASALERLSGSQGPPEEDLREEWDQVLPFCVVPVGGADVGDGDEEGDDGATPTFWPESGTHPPVEDRIERIRAVAA